MLNCIIKKNAYFGRMKILLKIILALLFSTALFAAAEDVNFNKETFLKAQADGKIVVVKSYNKYCFTCIKQSTVFKEAKKDFNNIVFMSFKQSDEDISEFVKINRRSTIVIYKDNQEIARSIGESDKSEIYSLIKKNI